MRLTSIFEMQDDEIKSYIKDNQLDQLIPFDYEQALFKKGERHSARQNAEHINSKIPYRPRWDYLVKIHRLCLERKVLTVLELGTGYSTLILADAMAKNQEKWQGYARKELRKCNLFEVHVVDAMRKYIKIAKKRIPQSLRRYVNFHFSQCFLGYHHGIICHFYENLPDISPDFILIDGPHPSSIQGKIRGISMKQAWERFPLSADSLAIEYCLAPGTMIVIDGRATNAYFLRNNFQRNWSYEKDALSDLHIFELIDEPLGPYNRKMLDYIHGKDWPASC